jgi:hypothetical protein
MCDKALSPTCDSPTHLHDGLLRQLLLERQREELLPRVRLLVRLERLLEVVRQGVRFTVSVRKPTGADGVYIPSAASANSRRSYR